MVNIGVRGHMVSGIKPDPFVEPSIQDTLDDIERIWDEVDMNDLTLT